MIKKRSTFEVIQMRAVVYVSLLILTGFNVSRGRFTLMPIMEAGTCICLTSYIIKAVTTNFSVVFMIIITSLFNFAHYKLCESPVIYL